MNKVLQWFLSLFRRRRVFKLRREYRTVDGGVLCPCPGMTDEMLHDFELCFDIRPRTFPRWPDRSAST